MAASTKDQNEDAESSGDETDFDDNEDESSEEEKPKKKRGKKVRPHLAMLPVVISAAMISFFFFVSQPAVFSQTVGRRLAKVRENEREKEIRCHPRNCYKVRSAQSLRCSIIFTTVHSLRSVHCMHAVTHTIGVPVHVR